MATGVTLKMQELPEASECSFCWSLRAILHRLNVKAAPFDIRGFSLSAFAIWAHPSKPVRSWKEVNCDLFVESLLRILGLRGGLLCVPRSERDLLGHFIRHWKGRVENSLQAGVPVAASEVWPEYLWGIITDWDSKERFLKGLIPGVKHKLLNTCWPRKLLIVGGPAVSPRIKASLRVILRQAETLGANRIPQGKWISGLDAYLLWLERIAETYTREANHHINLARYLAEARNDAALFLSHHTNFHNTETERMMFALARRYKTVAERLKEAVTAPGERPFINAVTEAVGEEEKALVLLDELLFRIE